MGVEEEVRIYVGRIRIKKYATDNVILYAVEASEALVTPCFLSHCIKVHVSHVR